MGPFLSALLLQRHFDSVLLLLLFPDQPNTLATRPRLDYCPLPFPWPNVKRKATTTVLCHCHTITFIVVVRPIACCWSSSAARRRPTHKHYHDSRKRGSILYTNITPTHTQIEREKERKTPESCPGKNK